jgi:hypothetical protein
MIRLSLWQDRMRNITENRAELKLNQFPGFVEIQWILESNWTRFEEGVFGSNERQCRPTVPDEPTPSPEKIPLLGIRRVRSETRGSVLHVAVP